MAKRILVVDDEASMRSFVGDILQEAGYIPTFAKSGEEALVLASRKVYDAELTDKVMGGMDGVELIAKLRATEGYLGVPILMVTADGSDTGRQSGRQAGATGWITKPFTPTRLVEVLDRFLG